MTVAKPRVTERPRGGAGESDTGPEDWLAAFLEARYTKLEKRRKRPAAAEKKEEEALRRKQESALERRAAVRDADGRLSDNGDNGFRSVWQPGRGKEILADLPSTYWLDLMQEYRKRQIVARKRAKARFNEIVDFNRDVPPAPGILGTNNWTPIGPSVVRRGQPTGRPAISGRANGIAIAPGGMRLYVATADGGVWRSDDAGVSWYSTMESFDVDPTAFAATSLACGAIAIDEADPDRVYVGTGEGDTNALFSSRLVSALPSYRGVGPLRSDNGGGIWNVEPIAPGSPALAGNAFFALAVDPGDRERVVAATNIGLYRREPDGSGGYHWVRTRTGIHSSVVVARAGTTTTFFAAAWGDRVYSSNDGATWTALGTGFPAGAGRIGLAVQRSNPNVLYALVASTVNELLGVYRLDNVAGSWRNVSGAPASLFGLGIFAQGEYDLTITVDPNDVNRIFMGGSAIGGADASIYRGVVTSSGSGSSLTYSMSAASVGSGAHADVHTVAYEPGSSSRVWACCDGGVFVTTSPSGAATFEARNVGLQTMSANYISQHPTQPAVLVSGFQDNGTGRYLGEECWTHIGPGDGGYPVLNWNDPYKVLVYWNGSVRSATDGGRDYASWTNVTPAGAGWFVMAQPLVTTPRNTASPADANVVAYGAGTSLFVSTNFGTGWTALAGVGVGQIYSMVFASASRLYVGTTSGAVYRYDFNSMTSSWSQTRIDNVAAGALPLTGLVSDIAVDPADTTGASIYITFGGTGDYRHVWRFNGTSWQARSGTAGSSTALLDVEHNAIVCDGTNAVYAAADIGVWQSTNGGNTWAPLEAGLPDAAVLDLQIHQGARLLRAALHGRGVYEYKLDSPTPLDVELYIRDTTLDVARIPTVDGLDDPATFPATPVKHYESPNIKIDVPTPSGYQTPSNQIDFYQFNDKITDGSGGVATMDPTAGTVTNRVYVEVHNRGIQAASVQVMLLLTPASAGLTLPSGYRTNVQNGTPITATNWQTVGLKSIMNLRVGAPQVIEFDLPSTMLPPPASLPGQSHQCLVAILHSPSDIFTSTQTNVDLLAVADRKVGQKNLHVVQFVGTPPPPGATTGMWVQLMLNGDKKELRYIVELDLHAFRGRLGMLAPRRLFSDTALKEYKRAPAAEPRRWAGTQRKLLQQWMKEGRFNHDQCAAILKQLARIEGQPLIILDGGRVHRLASGLRGKSQPLFLRIDPPKDAKPGWRAEFDVRLLADGKRVGGGSVYRVEVVPKPQ
jgi:hypothetical protein